MHNFEELKTVRKNKYSEEITWKQIELLANDQTLEANRSQRQ